MVKKLPSDLDIFSLSTLMKPLCIQTCENGLPVAPSLWAISFSWCGNCRSAPPPWMSKLAQHLAAHGRALDVPARPARAPGAGPLDLVGLAGLGAFPQHEVQRVLLAVLHGHAFAGLQFVQRLARQLAIAGELAHGKVHVAIAALVGQALVLQAADHGQHLRHVFGGARLMRGAFDAQGVGVLVQRVDHAVGQRTNGLAVLHGTTDDLVVDIGDVAHIGHAISAGPKPALHHVESDHGARVSQVAQVVHGHAAHIHAHMARFDWRKRFQCTRQRVVDTQTHGCSSGEKGPLQGRVPRAAGPLAPMQACSAGSRSGRRRARVTQHTPQLQFTAV